MLDINLEALKPFAAKYVWWKTVDEAVTQPQQIMAQVMSMGDYDDVQRLVAEVGDAVLTEVLMRAQPGQFDERSWAYWHYRLGLCGIDRVPSLPMRRFA